MTFLKKYSIFALAYLLWAVSVVISSWAVFRVREALLNWLVVASLDRYQSNAREQFYTALKIRATETWSYLLLGLAIIIIIVALESVFRSGALKGEVWLRFSLVTAIELGVLFLAELAIALAEGAIQPLGWGNFLTPVLYLIPAILFGWLWVSIRPKPVIDRAQ